MMISSPVPSSCPKTLGLGSALICSALLMGAAFAQSSSPVPAYLNPRASIETRVSDLMGRMTLKEKLGQLNLPCVYVDELGKTPADKIIGCKRFAAGTQTHEIGPGAGFFTLANNILNPKVRQEAEYFKELQ